MTKSYKVKNQTVSQKVNRQGAQILRNEPCLSTYFWYSLYAAMTKGAAQRRIWTFCETDSGFALIMTLWVLAILSVMLLTFSMMVGGNVRASSYFSKDTNACYLARGGVKRVALELAPKSELGKTAELAAIKGELIGKWLINPADWSVEKIGEKTEKSGLDEYIICEVTAEDSKLPLNRVTKDMFSKLPNVSPVLAEAIAAAQKSKDSPSGGPAAGPDTSQPKAGADSGGKAGESAGAMKTVEELLLVEGVPGKIYDGEKETPGLKSLLTTYTDGKIFINNARKEVIKAVPGVDDQLAMEIENRIKTGPFEKVEEVKNVLGVTPVIYKSLSGWLKVTPKYYRIKAKAFVNGIHRTAEGVVEVGKKNVEIVYMSGG